MKSCLCLWPWTPRSQQAYCISTTYQRNKWFCSPWSSVLLHLHSAAKWSAFYCNKDIIDLCPAGGLKKWDWCPTEKNSSSGWRWFCLRLNTYMFIPSVPQPSTDPTALYSHLPFFMSPSSLFPLSFSGNKKNISCKRVNAQSDMQKTLQSEKMTAFWDLHDSKKRAFSVFWVKPFSIKKETAPICLNSYSLLMSVV